MTDKEEQLHYAMNNYCLRPSFKDEAKAIVEAYEGSEQHNKLIAQRDRSLNEIPELLTEELVASVFSQFKS